MINYGTFTEAKKLLKSGKRKEAYEMFKQLHECEPGNNEITFEFGKCAISMGYYDYARELLELIAHKPSWIRALYELGKLDIKEDKIEDAKSKFNEILYWNDDDCFAKYELAKLEYRFGDKKKARELMEKLYDSTITDMALIQLADMDFQEKKYEDAEKKYLEALKKIDKSTYGKEYRCYINLGKIKMKQKNDMEAIKYFEKANRLHTDVAIELLLGKLYFNNNLYEDAERIYESIAYREKGLENNSAMLELAVTKYTIKDFDDAMKLFDKLKNVDKYKVTSLFYIAKMNFGRRKFDEAYEIFKELSYKYKHKYSVCEYAKMLLAIGNFDEAHDLLINQLKIDYEDKLYFQLGLCEFRLGNFDEAEQIFKSLYKTNMKSEVRKELAFVNIHQGKYLEAYNYLQEELMKNKNSSYEIYNAIVFVKVKLGLIDKASKEKNCYFFNQVDGYDEKRALEHIRLHCDEVEYKDIHSQFCDDIDVDCLYEQMRTIIIEEKPYTYKFIDKYVITLDYQVGYVENQVTNDLAIVTFPNTKDIITMYPFNKLIDENEYIDTFESHKKTSRVRQMSPIEKFYKRYGKL